jgi:hypothetical protein
MRVQHCESQRIYAGLAVCTGQDVAEVVSELHFPIGERKKLNLKINARDTNMGGTLKPIRLFVSVF